MAITKEAASLTAQQRQAQLTIRAGALRDYVRLWPIWTGDDASFELLTAASVPLVRGYHGLSATVAASYYQSFRRAERVRGTPTPKIAVPLPDAEIAGTLTVTGRDMANKAIRAGATPEAARAAALVRTSGTISRLALNGGRDTIVESTAADKQALGWARVTSGEPCAFCVMLASRGPSYSEEGSSFESHDHCACVAEPFYQGSEWPGRGQEFKELYNRVASGSDNPVNELRRALSGTT